MVLTSKNSPEKIEVKLIKVNGWEGFFRRVKRNALPFFLVLIISLGVAFGVSKFAQNQFRNFSGFDPVQVQAEELQLAQDLLQAQNDSRNFAEKTWDWFKTLNNVSDVVKNTLMYEQLRHQYNVMMIFIDGTIFWLPFLLVFYFVSKILHRVILAEKRMLGNIDSDMLENQNRLAASINKIGEKIEEIEANSG